MGEKLKGRAWLAMQPVSCRQQAWPQKFGPKLRAEKNLCGTRSHEEMSHKRNYGEQEQQMNQATGDMEHEKATGPQNQQQQSYHKKRSKSHYGLLGIGTLTPEITSRLYESRAETNIGRML